MIRIKNTNKKYIKHQNGHSKARDCSYGPVGGCWERLFTVVEVNDVFFDTLVDGGPNRKFLVCEKSWNICPIRDEDGIDEKTLQFTPYTSNTILNTSRDSRNWLVFVFYAVLPGRNGQQE